jgi:hypothetical protein
MPKPEYHGIYLAKTPANPHVLESARPAVSRD